MGWQQTRERLGFGNFQPTGGLLGHFALMVRDLAPSLGPFLSDDLLVGDWRGRRALAFREPLVPNDTRAWVTVAAVRLDPTLFFGLGIRPAARGAFGVFPDVVAARPEHQELLASGAFRARLEAAHAHDDRYVVATDSYVAVCARGDVPDRVPELLDAASELADALVAFTESFERFDGARASAWDEAARANGLAFDRRRMEITGTVHANAIRIALRTSIGVDAVESTLRFEPPLGLGLVLGPETGLGRMLSAVRLGDLQTRDRAFDDAFSIVAQEPKRALELLGSEPLRRALLELAAGSSQLAVDDRRLRDWRATPVGGPDRVMEIASALVAIAQAIGEAAPATAYRG
jgi:hypothetical protein